MVFWLLGIKHASLHWQHVETRGSHQQQASISQGAGVCKGESWLAPSLQPGGAGFAKRCLVLCVEETLGTEEAMLRCGVEMLGSPRLRGSGCCRAPTYCPGTSLQPPWQDSSPGCPTHSWRVTWSSYYLFLFICPMPVGFFAAKQSCFCTKSFTKA